MAATAAKKRRPTGCAKDDPAFMRELRTKLAAERQTLAGRDDFEARDRALALEDRIADLDRELGRCGQQPHMAV